MTASPAGAGAAGALPCDAVIKLARGHRATAALVGLVALLGGLAGCDAGRPSAGSVNGRGVSARTVDDVVEATASAFQAQGQDLSGEGADTYQADVASGVLQQLLLLKATEVVARGRGLELTEELRAAGADQVDTVLFGEQQAELGEQVTKAVSGDTRDILEALGAWRAALLADLGTEDPDARARAFYDDNPTQFEQLCLDGLVVQTQAQLTAAQARVEAGEGLAEVSAELSTNEQVRQAGGDLRCATREQIQQQLAPELAEPILAAEVGQVLDPVTVGEEIIVIGLRELQAVPYESVRDQIIESQGSASDAQLTEALRAELDGLDVQVDPRFGRWDGGTGRVIPPKPPSPPAGASTTTTAPAGGG